ncbi:MAG: WYL domain-containing protein [Candidatus Competibacteraceae bacterium]
MKPDMLERFAFIESWVYWGDGLSAQELGKVFGLARQTAQGVIDSYRRQHPGALKYDEHRRRQLATPDFQPHYIQESPAAFLDHLRAQAMNAYYMQDQEWDELPFYDVDHWLRPQLHREPIKALLTALLEHKNITLYYQSKLSARLREFSPNALIFAGNRYHIRGYCHLQQAFLDFVLSRIVQAEPSTTDWVSSRDDKAWNNFVTLRFQPHGELPEEARSALLHDFPMDAGGAYAVRCREALAFYITRELTAIDPRFSLPRWVKV